MGNKGFGILAIFAFIIFAGVAIYMFASFVSELYNSLAAKNEGPYNYKNEYAIYIKEHNIVIPNYNY